MEGKYKLTYLTSKGAGGSIRLLFAHAGIDFEDNQVTKEEWAQMKDSTPFGQLPILEYNGKVANQSNAIARFVATKANLVGANDWENLQIDAVVDSITDCGSKITSFFMERDPQQKEILRQKYFNETLPFYFERFEKSASANNGHLAVNKLNWSDFVFAAFADSFMQMSGGKLLEGYPNLQAVVKTVYGLPALKNIV